MESTQTLSLSYNGASVFFDPITKMGSLTAMWQACGEPKNQEPWRWLRQEQSKRIVGAIQSKYDLTENKVVNIIHGDRGGTWAHRQIATIYAHYLNPDFYLAWNQFVFDVLEGKHQPKLAIAELRRQLALREYDDQIAVLQAKRDALARAVIAPAAPMLPAQHAEVLALLADGQPRSFSVLYAALDWPKSTLWRRLGKMERDGLIARQQRGGYIAVEVQV